MQPSASKAHDITRLELQTTEKKQKNARPTLIAPSLTPLDSARNALLLALAPALRESLLQELVLVLARHTANYISAPQQNT